MKTYLEALESYPRSAEAKFLNGGEGDCGVTERRHIYAYVEELQLIGKEANRWEEQFFLGVDDEAAVTYPKVGLPQSLREEFQHLVEIFGQRVLADRLSIARGTLSN